MSDHRRWVRRIAYLLCIVALGACSNGSAEPIADPNAEGMAAGQEPEEDAIAVRTAPLSRDTLSELYATTATLRADKQATITARTQGVVHRLLAEEGHIVRQGQALAELENDEQKIAFERAYATAETRRREHERAESLHAQGLLSDEVYETSRREATDSRHSADLAELELKRTTIRAPFAGRVLERHVDLGVTLSDGAAVFDLADLDPLYADIGVPERHVARLSVGQNVRLSADSFNLSAEARIERIAPRVDIDTGTVKVTLAVGGRPLLRPGTFVRAAVVIDTHEQTLVVPRSALVPEGRRWHLFRIDATGDHVQRIEVRRGYEEGDRVEVTGIDPEIALSVGDAVVVVGASALSDGVRVDTGTTETAETSEADRAAS